MMGTIGVGVLVLVLIGLALEAKEREADKLGEQVFTEIVPAGSFYPAEAYHQKYRLRLIPALMEEFSRMVSVDDDFVASTAAVRVNGYLGGHGTLETLQAEMDDLGLSPEGRQKLLDIFALTQAMARIVRPVLVSTLLVALAAGLSSASVTRAAPSSTQATPPAAPIARATRWRSTSVASPGTSMAAAAAPPAISARSTSSPAIC